MLALHLLDSQSSAEPYFCRARPYSWVSKVRNRQLADTSMELRFQKIIAFIKI